MSALFIVLVIIALISVRFYIEVSGEINVIDKVGCLSVVVFGVFTRKSLMFYRIVWWCLGNRLILITDR